jgi:hypothetical protein
MEDRYAMTPTPPRDTADETNGLTVRDVVRLKFGALLFRHAAAAELTVLEARRRMAEARTTTEEAEAECQLRRTLRQAPTEQGRQILGQETEIERLLLEREHLRQQRWRNGLPGAGSPLPALPAAIEWEVSDQQIESLAVKAVTRFSQLPPAEAERAWARWRRELGVRLPPYAAAEVARRAQALRNLAR